MPDLQNVNHYLLNCTEHQVTCHAIVDRRLKTELLKMYIKPYTKVFGIWISGIIYNNKLICKSTHNVKFMFLYTGHLVQYMFSVMS